MKESNWFRKGLIIGIIVLFIGIAVAPSVNSIDIVRSKNIQEIIVTSDSIDDCNCEVVSKSDIYKIERLLNRLEVYTKLLLILSRDNPEVKEKFQELLDVINSNPPPRIPMITCIWLGIIMGEIIVIDRILYALYHKYLETNPILAEIIGNINNQIGEWGGNILLLGEELGCWQIPPYP